MAIEFFDHTADIGVRLKSHTLEGLFEEGAVAFTNAVSEAASVEARDERRATIGAPELDRLLLEWLEEILAWFDIDQWLLRAARVRLSREGDTWKLEATAEGEPLDPERHHVKVLIKAVTYHELAVEQTPDGWSATVIFDI
jgi:SHS2 domain-containing protein